MTTRANETTDYPSHGGKKQCTREEAYKELQTNEKCHDIVQLGSIDGMQFPAARALLAKQSSVFGKMLFGDFSECKKMTVKCAFKGSAVKALLDYIYNGEVEILVASGNDEAQNGRIHDLVELATAAEYYDVSELGKKIHFCLSEMLEQETALSSLKLLQVCHQQGPAAPGSLKKLALSAITSLILDGYNDPGSFSVLSHEDLQEILQDEMIIAAHRFEVVRVWAAAEPTNDDTSENRSFIAAKLVEDHIDIEKIGAKYLVSTVMPSGLVPPTKICEFLGKIAEGVENMTFMFYEGNWKKSGTDTIVLSSGTGALWCQPVIQEKATEHRWTFKVEACDPGIVLWFGLLDTRLSGTRATYKSVNKRFGWSSDGHWWTHGRSITSELTNNSCLVKSGDELTMVVRSFGAEGDNVTLQLEVQVNDVSVVSDRLDFHAISVVPAVTLQEGSGAPSIRILGCHRRDL